MAQAAPALSLSVLRHNADVRLSTVHVCLLALMTHEIDRVEASSLAQAVTSTVLQLLHPMQE